MSCNKSYSRRIIFDASTLARWFGPPVGIVRVEHELARWAHKHMPEVIFAGFNPNRQRYQQIGRKELEALILGSASIDTLGLSDPAGPGRRKTDRIPALIRPTALWVLQFRRKLLQTLERIRLRTGSSGMMYGVDKLQRLIMSRKHETFMVEHDGRRRAYIPWDMAVSADIDLRSMDILVCAGAGWAHTNIRAITRLKQSANFALALLCHDIIPLLFPEFYKPRDAEVFRDYFEIAFPLADLVVFTSHKVAADARAYCEARGIALRRIAVSPLGADSISRAPALGGLPAGLEQGKYALLVSTVEPRKGHRMIYNIWQRLLKEGIPRTIGFKLLFVGRPGWMVDDLMQVLSKGGGADGSLHYLPSASDRTLAALYQNAAFCLYPSLYEGYGLPVFEAFSHGKAVLASNGGALGEISGELSPLLDPSDEEAWYRGLKAWILDPGARAPFEKAIRGFKHQSWAEAAAAFFCLIAELPIAA